MAAITLVAGGANAGGADPFTVEVKAPTAKAGAASSAHVEIKAGSGFHMNKDYPTSLKLVAPAGVELPKATLTKKDGGVSVAAEGIAFEVPFTAREAGKKTIEGTLSFAVCSETTCDPRKAKVAIPIDAK